MVIGKQSRYLLQDIENARQHYQILKKYAPDSAMAKEYSKDIQIAKCVIFG